MMNMITRMVVTGYGGPEKLEAVEEPLRKPEPGEIRVKVQSAGVALADIMRREGKYPLSPTPPFTPGYDAVGLVDEVGEGAEDYSPGRRSPSSSTGPAVTPPMCMRSRMKSSAFPTALTRYPRRPRS
ncbi:alcohol dehydrogenase catalytic domain-containing protein [Paenibacillus sp. P26]|nr:alcohol dehydrogenase catalytic domain-containing protein [Paenibacillus sp. P26]UUZ90524.1 alcohol dehydrogenase catalytic domain-containing protein [Paenibacillus sp. P25]